MPLRLHSSGVRDHPSLGKNQGKLRTNQLQLTPALPSLGLRTKRQISYAQIRRRQPKLLYVVEGDVRQGERKF
jgi:hypothetical protein